MEEERWIAYLRRRFRLTYHDAWDLSQNMAAYGYARTYRQAIDALRRFHFDARKRKHVHTYQLRKEEEESLQAPPFQSCLEVLELIDSLPQAYRSTVARLLEGYQYQEIARQDGISKSALTYRMRRIRKLLEGNAG